MSDAATKMNMESPSVASRPAPAKAGQTDSPRQTPRPSWQFFRFLCFWFSLLLLKARAFARHNVPQSGGVLLVCNHQSFMDPVLVSIYLHRESSYMARDTLFIKPMFRKLITFLNAFPIRRDTADTAAIKEALRRLKSGACLVVFPEGTRTPDGRLQKMRPGITAIAKKAKVPLVPTFIDGMYQAWPRSRKYPGPGDVVIEYGKPITPEEYANLSPDEMTTLLEQRLAAMQANWHRRVASRRLKS
jgi:1-acyl-sn-glycerol-3-phosphate acyltransferase